MSPYSSTPELPVYSNLETYISCIENLPLLRKEGRVMQVIGHMVEATNPGCSVGGMCKIFNPATNKSVAAQVVGFRKDRMLVMPLHNAYGIGPKCRVVPEDRPAMVPVGDGLLGRVFDPLMRPLDGFGELLTSTAVSYTHLTLPTKRIV